jgi:ketosteroid isomerase-like protein
VSKAPARQGRGKSSPRAEQTIQRFYAAFAQLDGAAMQACYAADAQFDDEVFSLQGRQQIGGMWRMLCDATQAKGRDVWRLEASDITATGAHWEAHYRFSATGRLVHNIIDAQIECGPDGLIRRHRDRFDFWRWSRQALGAPGLLLGWTPFLRAKVRAQAAANLAKSLAAQQR